MIEIILPNNTRIQHEPKEENVAYLCWKLVTVHRLSPGLTWQLRGPRGPINPRRKVRNIELSPGEAVKLEARQ